MVSPGPGGPRREAANRASLKVLGDWSSSVTGVLVAMVLVLCWGQKLMYQECFFYLEDFMCGFTFALGARKLCHVYNFIELYMHCFPSCSGFFSLVLLGMFFWGPCW